MPSLVDSLTDEYKKSPKIFNFDLQTHFKKVKKNVFNVFCFFFAIRVVFTANLFRLKSERHETQHVGPLITLECVRPNRFFKSLILAKSIIFR